MTVGGKWHLKRPREWKYCSLFYVFGIRSELRKIIWRREKVRRGLNYSIVKIMGSLEGSFSSEGSKRGISKVCSSRGAETMDRACLSQRGTFYRSYILRAWLPPRPARWGAYDQSSLWGRFSQSPFPPQQRPGFPPRHRRPIRWLAQCALCAAVDSDPEEAVTRQASHRHRSASDWINAHTCTHVCTHSPWATIMARKGKKHQQQNQERDPF